MGEKKFKYKAWNSLFPVRISLPVYFEMDTSMCSVNSQHGSQLVAQRRFYQWVLKWLHGHSEWNHEEPRDIRCSTKPDVPTLASFLQAIGFKLLSFEKHNHAYVKKDDESNLSTPEAGSLRIAIECGTSSMRALLELGEIPCRCPNPEHIKDASFWSISGTGPTGSVDSISQKVEETGSNLLPRLSQDVTRVLRDVSYKLFDIITCEPDVNRNVDVSLHTSQSSSTNYESKVAQDSLKNEIGVTRSYTQPELLVRTNSLNSKNVPVSQEKDGNSSGPSQTQRRKSVLQRQKTWDVDIETRSLNEEPRPSPPKITSSPVVVLELSNSLGQISLHGGNDSPKDVTEYIIGAQQNLEKALKILFTKPNQDSDRISVKSAPTNVSPAAVVSPYKPSRLSTANSGMQPLPRSGHLTHGQPSLAKSGVLQTPKARLSIEPTLPKPVARRSMQIEQENSKQTVRRKSFYLPSSANSNFSLLSKTPDTRQTFLGNGKLSAANVNFTSESEHLNRTHLLTRNTASPEPRTATPNSESSHGRAASMIKPPSKISKSIPVKIKPMQQSKVNTGIGKKRGVSLSKE